MDAGQARIIFEKKLVSKPGDWQLLLLTIEWATRFWDGVDYSMTFPWMGTIQ
jgi:hypothetical protein